MFFGPPLSVEVAYPQRDKEIIRGEPCCIIASSGMLKGGPSVGYAKQILGKEDSAILFSGYQAEETPGREIISSEEEGIEIK